MAKAIKTNVLRHLDALKIPYETREYTVDDDNFDGKLVAEKVDLPAEMIYKTLVLVGDTLPHLVCVIPVELELDLKAVARAAGCKSVHMLPQKDLLPLTGYLRGELGMRGMCITDFSGSSQYMDLVDGLIAGSDIWDSPMPKIHTTKAANYENDAYIVTQMRNAMHHILYTVVNSNAMNGWSSTDTLKTVTPWWQTAIYALIAVMAVLTILCAWQLSKAKKGMVDTAPAADQK